ncbi:hypothetical protein [Herbidospora sp. NBRC 101105]|uniref:hypothetical protein n=1 Tax=Herbidospora sp. NBRC 101105 TaxID=3032195 RepID=UPI0024A4940C|nr:hypothetical protein [Herbidospora sp. NBRC 101105]GLX92390.1 hypothetical protein Hesp01_03400 [Herbidospora sp. NBRC 101105]
MQIAENALPEESQWDLLVEHCLESFNCLWVDTEDVGEIARRLGAEPDSGTPCDFPTAMRASGVGRKTLVVWVGEHAPGWSVVLTVNRGSVPPEIVEALSSGGRRVLEAYFHEVVHRGHLIYLRDGDYIGDVYPPSEPGGKVEVEEFAAHGRGLELLGELSDAETFDRFLVMMGRITGRFIDRPWFSTTRTLHRVSPGA